MGGTVAHVYVIDKIAPNQRNMRMRSYETFFATTFEIDKNVFCHSKKIPCQIVYADTEHTDTYIRMEWST